MLTVLADCDAPDCPQFVGTENNIGNGLSTQSCVLSMLQGSSFPGAMKFEETLTSPQRHCIVGDVVRLLHLQEACDDMAGLLACDESLSWRLSLAMELVSSPSLLIIDGAHPSTLCSPHASCNIY